MDLEFAINELTEEFYINYEECKFNYTLITVFPTVSFILTMRNVNVI